MFAQVNKGNNAFVVPYGDVHTGFNMNLNNMIQLKKIVTRLKNSEEMKEYGIFSWDGINEP